MNTKTHHANQPNPIPGASTGPSYDPTKPPRYSPSRPAGSTTQYAPANCPVYASEGISALRGACWRIGYRLDSQA